MELSAPLAVCVGRLANASLIGRLPGIAVFGAGLIAGGLAVALAGWLAGRSLDVHAGAAPDLATSPGERARPGSPMLLPGGAAGCQGQDAPQRGQEASLRGQEAPLRAQAAPTAGKAEAGPACRDEYQHRQEPALRIGMLGSLIVNGLAGVDTITPGAGVAALILLTINQD